MIEKLTYDFDEDIAAHKIGLVVLQSDEVMENEFRQIFDDKNVSIHHSRIKNSDTITLESLSDMENTLPEALRLFPSKAKYDVIGYGCTSGATVIGSQKIKQIVQNKFPESLVTDPIESIIAAIRGLNVKNIALVTPYERSVSEAMIRLLEKEGIKVVQFASFNVTDDHIVAHISPSSIQNAMIEAGKNNNVEAVFASCTNLRALNIIESVEKIISKPVLTSNQALAWNISQLGNIKHSPKNFGRLFLTT